MLSRLIHVDIFFLCMTFFLHRFREQYPDVISYEVLGFLVLSFSSFCVFFIFTCLKYAWAGFSEDVKKKK